MAKVAFCKRHWEDLNDSLRTAGVWPHVIEDDTKGLVHVKAGGFEPRLLASALILFECIKTAGGSKRPVTDGGCPVCWVIERCTCGRPQSCHFHEMVTEKGASMAIAAHELGLILEGEKI